MARGLSLSAFTAVLLSAVSGLAQSRGVYPLYRATAPPGEISFRQTWSRPGLAHFVQPVSIRVPEGSWVAIATQGGFSPAAGEQLVVGIQAGCAYRLHVQASIGGRPLDVYPTIELIDRLYAPGQQQLDGFPIVIELTVDDLRLAGAGHLVSKVVYVEDPGYPSLAQPGGGQSWFDVLPEEDPLEVADQLGRPVAMVRLGSRTPPAEGPDAAFLFGSPPVTFYPETASTEPPAGTPAETQKAAAGETAPADDTKHGAFVELHDEAFAP